MIMIVKVLAAIMMIIIMMLVALLIDVINLSPSSYSYTHHHHPHHMKGIQLPHDSIHHHNDSSGIGDHHHDGSNISSRSSSNIHPEIDHHTIIESVRKHFEVKEREGIESLLSP